MVSAAMSVGAVHRAARLGVGLLFDSLSTPERIRELSDSYHEAGGHQPCVLIRRVWLGEPPTAEVDRQVERYRGYAAPDAQVHWKGEQLLAADDADALAGELASVADRAGADALNLRIHVPGISAGTARDQIDAMGGLVAAVGHWRKAASARHSRIVAARTPRDVGD